MAFSGSRFTANPPVHLSDIKTRRLLPFQIRCEGKSESKTPKKLSFSRRDAIIGLTALSSSAIAISSPEIAEARISNSKAEMRRKIKEKLELLREKAGLSKKNESDKGKLPSPLPPAKKENNLLLQPSPLPLPDPPLGRSRSLVEATYDQ